MVSKASLVKKFVLLGVDDPESWASSQENEGIDQIARATVLASLVDATLQSTLAGPKPEFLRATEIGKTAWDEVSRSGVNAKTIAELCMTAFASGVEQTLLRLSGATELVPNPDSIEVSIVKFDADSGTVDPLDDLYESFGRFLEHKLGRDL
jgi:hypothetical protein